MSVESSRELRRRLGPVAWAVLGEVCDDAELDALGRRVAPTSARRLAEALGVSKDTAARALGRLVAVGILERLPAGRGDHGRFGAGGYVVLIDQPVAHATPTGAFGHGRRSVNAGGQGSLFEERA